MIQRWYRVVHWKKGNGGRKAHGASFPSREHAKAWAKRAGMTPDGEQMNGTGAEVYVIEDVTPRVTPWTR